LQFLTPAIAWVNGNGFVELILSKEFLFLKAIEGDGGSQLCGAEDGKFGLTRFEMVVLVVISG
jgi:hypothetical protein